MSALDDYEQAIHELIEARRGLAQIIKTVQVVARCFDGWEKVPPGAFNGQFDRNIEAWPDRAQMAAAVKAWQAAAKKAANVWDMLSARQRLIVTAPGKIEMPE